MPNERGKSVAVSPKKPIAEEVLFEEHYKKVEPEARALSAEDVQKVNLDVATAVSSALAIAPGLGRLRDTITTTLKDFDIERFDKLEDYTKAFSVANSRYLTAATPPDALRDAYTEGLKLRELLHADIVNLIARGYINSDALADYTGVTGYKNVGTELQSTALLLKDNWETVQGKCGTDLTELEHALKIAQRLQLGAGEREVNPAVLAEFAEMRNRMFTLFIAAYDDARRAVQYLRWHQGDADDIAPTLYAGRGTAASKKRPDKPEDGVPAPAASNVQASPTAATGTTTRTGTDGFNGPFMT